MNPFYLNVDGRQRSGHWHRVEDVTDNLVRGHVFGFRFIAQDDPVSEHVRCNGFDILGGYVSATLQEGICPGGQA